MDKMGRKKEALIAGLLRCKTIDQAAREAGISARTARNWMADAAFASAYASARREVLERSIGSLSGLTLRSVRTLRRNLRCGHVQTEVASARAILEFALRGGEMLDLVGRVVELEKRLEELNAAKPE